MKTRTLWLGLVIAVALTVHSRGATVNATIDPAEVALGDMTELTVTVSGGDQPKIPDIDGLVIQAGQTSSRYSFSLTGSGAPTTTSETTITYTVTPQRAGTFTIPALQVGDAKSQPLTLHVTGAGTAQASSQPPQQTQGGGPVVMPPGGTQPQAPDEDTAQAAGKYGAVIFSIDGDKKELYEGEIVPVTIKMYLDEDAHPSVGDLPQFTSDGLALNNLSNKPAKSEEMVQGRAYIVLTWHNLLTAVKPGDFKLAISAPIKVVVQTALPSLDDMQGSAMDIMRRMMQNGGFGGEEKAVTLTNTPESLKVLPLPREGRPADFSGAVGTFEAETSATPTQVNAGDPVTVKMTVTGHGNFDRVTSNLLPSDANWKTYSPKTSFTATDVTGYEGTKTFEQPAIPNNGSITSVPSLSFSYFDPEKRQYATCTTPPIPIRVSGAVASFTPAPAPAPPVASNASAPAASQPPAALSDLRMNRIESGATVSTLEPVYLSPLFLAGQALPLVALLGGLAWLRRQQSVLHPDRVRLGAAQEAIRRKVAAMDAAMRDKEAGAFFVHARNALQQRYGQQWNVRPEAITALDVESRLGEAGTNVRSIFEMADQASYSDLHLGDADLQQWRTVVMNELTETKK